MEEGNIERWEVYIEEKRREIPSGALGRFMPPLAGWLAGWQPSTLYTFILLPGRGVCLLTKGSCRILYDMHRKLIDGYYVPLRRAYYAPRSFSFSSRSPSDFTLPSVSRRDFSVGKLPSVVVYRFLRPFLGIPSRL